MYLAKCLSLPFYQVRFTAMAGLRPAKNSYQPSAFSSNQAGRGEAAPPKLTADG
jgi:hypothetical protein